MVLRGTSNGETEDPVHVAAPLVGIEQDFGTHCDVQLRASWPLSGHEAVGHIRIVVRSTNVPGGSGGLSWSF